MKKSTAIVFSITLLSGLVLFSSCKKNSDGKSRKEYITTSSWKFSQAGLDADDNGTVDQIIPTILLQSCSIDNLYTFKTDLTGTSDEGATKCNAADLQTTPFTWSLSNNDTELAVSIAIFAGIDGGAKILQVNESKFSLSKKVAVTGYATPQTVIVDMVHP